MHGLARIRILPGGWRLHRNPRDYRFLVADGHALPVSFRRSHPPNAHFLFQEQAALNDEHFFDNRNHNSVALFSDGRHRVDMLADRGPFDFYRLAREQLVD